jgi:hypothetical protein
MLRGLKALVLAAVLLSALAPAASADDGVNVSIDGRSPRFYSQAALAETNDSPDSQTWFTISPDLSRQFVGPSVRGLLKLIGISLDHVVQVGVQRTSYDGKDVVIMHDQIQDGYDGPDGHRDAKFGTEFTTGMEFIRPLASAGDYNGHDWITSSGQIPLNVSVTTDGKGHELTLDARVDDTTPEKGTASRFTVSVVGDQGAGNWTYQWNFDDGETSTEQNPRHTYGVGNWQPTVSVTGPDGSSASFTFNNPEIQVTAPADPTTTATPTPLATATANGTTPGTGGPGAGKGGAPSGGGEGKKSDRSTGAKRSKGSGERTTNGAKRAPTPTAAATATAGATSTPTPTSVPSGSGDGNAGGRANPGESEQDQGKSASSAPTPGATVAPETAAPKGAATNGPRGEQVDGILLASAGTIADVIDAARSAEQAKDDRAQARRGGGDSPPIAGWVGGGAGLIGLLLLGALREGGFRRRRPSPSLA